MAGSSSCPRCRRKLYVRQPGDLVMGECAHCGGLWLDNRGCQRLVTGQLSELAQQTIRAVDATAPQAGEPRPGGYRAPPTEGADDPPLLCPICGAVLTSYVTSEELQGVRVALDACASHGTWFDRGEAWKLLQAVQLKKLAFSIELATDAERMTSASREDAWGRFIDGAIAGAMPRRRW